MRGPNATTFVPRPVPPRRSQFAHTRPYEPNWNLPSCEDGSCTTCAASLPRATACVVAPGTDGAVVSETTGTSGNVPVVFAGGGACVAGAVAGAGAVVGAGAAVAGGGGAGGGGALSSCARADV